MSITLNAAEHRCAAMDAFAAVIRGREEMAAAHARAAARNTSRGHHTRALLHAEMHLEEIGEIRDLRATLADVLTGTEPRS